MGARWRKPEARRPPNAPERYPVVVVSQIAIHRRNPKSEPAEKMKNPMRALNSLRL
jgi:hypothetical protein